MYYFVGTAYNFLLGRTDTSQIVMAKSYRKYEILTLEPPLLTSNHRIIVAFNSISENGNQIVKTYLEKCGIDLNKFQYHKV